MRKTISILLSMVIFAMSVFSTTAFAQEQTRLSQWLQNNSFDEIEANIYIEDEYGETKSHIYLKGDKFSVTSELPLFEEKEEMNLVYDGNNTYVIFTALPFFHLKIDEIDISITDYLNEMSSNFDSTFVKGYEKSEGSKTYYVEEYSASFDSEDYSENGILKCYFEGNELVKSECIFTDENGESVYSRMEYVSFDVDDSVFEIPWYSINILPLFKALLSLFDIGIVY